MINPSPLPHRGSPRNLELIYRAQKNKESEEAVLWLDITAILHLGDVSLNPRKKSGNTTFAVLRKKFVTFLLHEIGDKIGREKRLEGKERGS